MTKYEAFRIKHKAMQTETEQKALLSAYLHGLSAEELIQWYMETPNIIEENLNELIELEGNCGQQEAQEYLASVIEVLEKNKKFVKAAA